jgi:hypothetical protein
MSVASWIATALHHGGSPQRCGLRVILRRKTVLGSHDNTVSKKDRLAARLTRGSQPDRRREKGKRFSRANQPKRQRGRPPGATNLLPREVAQAIITAFAELGENLRGKGGLVGFIKRIGRTDLKTSANLLLATMPRQVTIKEKKEIVYQSADEVRAELNRSGIPIDSLFQLEYIKQPVVDVEATDVTNEGTEADDPHKDGQ